MEEGPGSTIPLTAPPPCLRRVSWAMLVSVDGETPQGLSIGGGVAKSSPPAAGAAALPAVSIGCSWMSDGAKSASFSPSC